MVTSYNTVPVGSKSVGNTGLIIFGLLVAAAAGYYFFVYKPEEEKKQKQSK